MWIIVKSTEISSQVCDWMGSIQVRRRETKVFLLGLRIKEKFGEILSAMNAMTIVVTNLVNFHGDLLETNVFWGEIGFMVLPFVEV